MIELADNQPIGPAAKVMPPINAPQATATKNLTSLLEETSAESGEFGSPMTLHLNLFVMG
jgi:hypothetical protein